MSRKIRFKTVYKKDADGNRIDIPALKGKDGKDGSGGGAIDLDRTLTDPSRAAPADLVGVLSSDIAHQNNKDENHVAAGLVWTSTADGAGWAAPTGGGISYSTEEFDTDKTWIDGKKIYSKVVDFGYLPNKSIKTVIVDIANGYDSILYVNGFAKNSDYVFPVPLASPTAPIIVYIERYGQSKVRVHVETTTDRSSLYSHITIEYTK